MSAELAAYHEAKVRTRAEEVRLREQTQAAYRRLGDKVPADFEPSHPLRADWQRHSSEEQRRNAANAALLEKLANAVGQEELKRYQRVWYEHHFRDDNALQAQTHASPSGAYRVLITQHPTGPGTWAYSRGRVFEGASNTLIAEVRRNFSAFPFSWVEQHASGHDYLVCGEDYQGQTVIELDSGRRVDYRPEEANRGQAFCWAAHWPSPDGRLLAVDGCYWACPYEVLIVDFSQPMTAPWPIVYRAPSADAAFDDAKFLRWTSPTSCTLEVSYDVRTSDGKRLDALSEDEAGVCRQSQGKSNDWETRTELLEWRLP